MKTPEARRLASLLATAVLLSSGSAALADFVPVPLPDPKIPGYHFPENEATILKWVADSSVTDPTASAAADNQIYLHGWGIWASLTAETDQTENGQKLRVFETWLTPQDITAASQAGKNESLLKLPRGSRPVLEEFRQLKHHKGKDPHLEAAGTATVLGFVKYDPTAADHIMKQGLLQKSVLDQLLSYGADEIPVFPVTGLALKPVFQVIKKSDLVDGRYYQLPVWPGPPSTPQQWGSTTWPASVWIDVKDGGSGKGEIDKAPKKDGSSRTDATTYPVSSLINFKLNPDQAGALKAKGAAEGDYAILVAMHVSGREITRWTWQTFWWTPTPANPLAPSSDAIAKARPVQIKAPAANYAMSIAYTTELPSPPYVGGDNKGNSIYAYNPWLEAGFGPSDLPDSIPGTYNGQPVQNNYGVQSNCMSCHGAANYNPNNVSTAPDYSGDRYISLGDPRFSGTLKVDFLWSLPGNAK
ncbi:hypothetical protein KBB96_10825 [Luteolibacter ambystomatis]|uniref:Cytochrome c domain-containing protein n=1 Tax=Luteolibacter ambystomatis TaxID=2824561 RepID=A0A975IXS0_9BACT|nr:hypothetical protein [Luteolibacter ambystomatis]QUE49364.1 hypothetical protein KBB96_10825 [Luteolibacter ambystomatis]